MQTKTAFLLSLAGVVVVLFIGFLVFRPHVATAPVSSLATSTTSTTSIAIGNATITAPAGVTIQQLPDSSSSGVTPPDLNHVVAYSPDLPANATAMLKTQIATWVSDLKKDPSNGQDWLQLAVDYKIAGDYSAAESVWVYMTKVAPTSPVAFQDLGDLYQNFEVNYPKAEANYLAAVKLDPTNIDVYSDLYTLYRYQENNPTAAANIVAQGLKANPNNPTLLQLQSQTQSGQ